MEGQSLYILSLVFASVVMTANIPNAVGSSIRERVKRVIGGEEIEAGEWPYLVRLRGKVPSRMLWGIPVSYNNYYCGGSVIHERWVLTAAHCVQQYNYSPLVMTPSYWHAKVGDIQAEDNFYDGILHWVGRITSITAMQTWNVHASRIVVHPEYREAESWKNDIALFKLEEDLPVHTHPHIGSVLLPPPQLGASWPEDGSECIMKGWGCSSKGGYIENVARSAMLPKVSDRECNRVYAVSSATRLCAGHRLRNKGICSGDSGGPLVCRYNGNWTLAGIASFTSANNPESFPGVFTRVTEYIDWIEDVIIEDYYNEFFEG